MTDLKTVFEYIDSHSEDFVSVLAEAVAIPSVSAWPDFRPEVVRMVQWTKSKLEALGVSVELIDAGKQSESLDLPPILIGTLGSNPSKKTLLIYGHLDVQPAKTEDGWTTKDPFILEKSADGSMLIGRGATDDKGPVLGWIHAIEAFQQNKMDLPVNVKFILEGMEESGSLGLKEYLNSVKESSFLRNVDFVCISDNYWLGKEKPCITYGLRGICYFFIEIKCCKKDLHSGVFGGTVHEAMADLIALLNTLIDKNGNILIEDILRDVDSISAQEDASYDSIDFDIEDFKNDLQTSSLITKNDIKKTLMARWRFPSLSIHGIEGAFSDPGEKTVIPSRVIGKFSVRIVPSQTPESVEKIVVRYLEKKWKERESVNCMKVSMSHGGSCWISDISHPNYEAGKRATRLVYGVEPDMIREGGSIPITLTLEETTGKNVMLLPMGCSDDGAHSQNEKINLRNYIQGTKLLAAYMHELSQ